MMLVAEGSKLGLENYRRGVSEAKRASILRAARDIFLRDGYSRAAVADIARDADVSTATLYKHFSSKEELFAAVVRDAYLVDEYQGIAEDVSAEEIIVAVIMRYLHSQYDRRINALLRIVIAEVPSAPQLGRDMFDNFVTARYRDLSAIVDRLIARGKLKPHDTHYAVRLLGGIVKEYFVWPALFAADKKLPDNAEALVRQVVRDYLTLYGA